MVAHGTPPDILKHPESLTGNYLSGRKKIALPSLRTLPPLPGQHNQEILRAAGFSESDIARLIETGALGPGQGEPSPP